MSEPVHIAAIDAGSNAVRLSVARAYSALDIEPVHTERYPLRLGESVFVRPRFSEEIFKKAAKAFRHFRELMDEFGVTRYRAVATSATREARNRKLFVRRIKQKSGIKLEVISAGEESRLGREAVLAALGPEAPPRCIADLGGGSLEISILRDHTVEQGAQLPLGTVRLMTTLELPGVIRPAEAEQVRRYVRALLESKLGPRPNLGESIAVALGGNAETLANVAPGPRQHGLQTMELSLLRERLPDILRRDVRERMKAYAVRRDRADVMAVAAITFLTLGRYLNLRTFALPGVGVREGLLQEIAREAFSRKEPHRYNAAARQLLVGTRSFARRIGYEQQHAEHVRELSILLFDQLQAVHHLPARYRAYDQPPRTSQTWGVPGAEWRYRGAGRPRPRHRGGAGSLPQSKVGARGASHRLFFHEQCGQTRHSETCVDIANRRGAGSFTSAARDEAPRFFSARSGRIGGARARRCDGRRAGCQSERRAL